MIINCHSNMANSFIKWVGSKYQLIQTLEDNLPLDIKSSKYISTYVENFIGGGSFLIYLLENYSISNAYAIDLNKDLINLWKIIQNDHKSFMEALRVYKEDYLSLDNMDKKKEYYFSKRDIFNSSNDVFLKSVLFVFLNKVCFNGLYRVNKKGEFNTSFGKRDSDFFDEKEINEINKLIKNVNFIYGEFDSIKVNGFYYLDPPYRPITSGSHESYTKEKFEFNKYLNYLNELDDGGNKFLASDSCFENYKDKYKFNTIEIETTNFIKRVKNKEILVRNY